MLREIKLDITKVSFRSEVGSSLGKLINFPSAPSTVPCCSSGGTKPSQDLGCAYSSARSIGLMSPSLLMHF